MQLNNYAIEKMGYTKYPEDDLLSVKFAVQRVYSLQGLCFKAEDEIRLSGNHPVN